MIVLGFPTGFLGYAAIFYMKIANSRAHFQSWHGVSPRSSGLRECIYMLLNPTLDIRSLDLHPVVRSSHTRRWQCMVQWTAARR